MTDISTRVLVGFHLFYRFLSYLSSWITSSVSVDAQMVMKEKSLSQGGLP